MQQTDASAAGPRPATRPAIEGRSGRVAYLDGWRGVSILAVLAGHFPRIAGINLGILGVELFFVLSGRLMAEILFVERFPLPSFYRRRFSRIYPALFCFVLACYVLVHWTPLRFRPTDGAAALFLIYNYVAANGHHVRALDHIWSLCVEEHAYLLLGALAFVSRRRRLPVVALLCGVSALSMLDGAYRSMALHQDWFTAYWRTDAHVGSIFCAAAVYLLTRSGRPLAFLRQPAVALLAAAAGLALYIQPTPIEISYSFGTVLLAVAVCTLDDAPAWLRRLFSSPGLTFCGVLSYSVYIWQQPFFQFGYYRRELIALPLLLPALLCGLVSFYGVERPARRFLNGLGRKPTERSSATGVPA